MSAPSPSLLAAIAAMPDGGQEAIASLREGDRVETYDPETGKASTQTVEHIWINHDDDLIDLTLRSDAGSQARAVDVPAKQQDAEVAAHGLRAPPTASENQHSTVSDETIHTTFKHPWLTVDRGWVQAGDLRAGEQVVRLDGGTATVAAVRLVPGAATMYNLQVSQLHTFAVGTGQYVVHNCDYNALATEGAQALHSALKKATGFGKFTVVVGYVENEAGNVGRVVGINADAFSRRGARLTYAAVKGVLHEGDQFIVPDGIARGTHAAGHAHAEDFLVDYIRNHSGNILRGVGSSARNRLQGQFCSACRSRLQQLVADKLPRLR